MQNAFAKELAQTCRHEMDTMELTPGEISNGGENTSSSSRSDVRAFLSRTTSERPPSLGALAMAVENVRLAMCPTYETDRSTVMVAKYHAGTGTGYVRHRDATNEEGGRRITVLCYLGQDRMKGGHLRVYGTNEGESQEEDMVVADIQPESGLIVIFRSYRLHEVTSVEDGTRYALTSWWTNKSGLARELLLEERLKALRKLAFKRLQRQMKRNHNT